MEIISPSLLSSSSFWFDDYLSTRWTKAENKMFESALALHDKETPDRWHKVAAMIPGKTVVDVIKQYRELEDDVSNIEAGLVPFPVYDASAFTLELVNRHGFSSLKQQPQQQNQPHYGKRSNSSRSDMERKKGIPWTEEEHKLFLMGLKRYGKGDWRNISRNFVITRTPTQVASHAQKYFIRQLTGGKDKRRASIHDITTVNLTESPSPTCSEKNKLLPPASKPTPPTSSSVLRHWSLQRSSIPSINTNANILIHHPPTSSRMQIPVLNEPYLGAIHHDHDPSCIDYFVA